MTNQNHAWEVTAVLDDEYGFLDSMYRFKFVVPTIAAGQVEIVGETLGEVVFAPDGPVGAFHYFDAELSSFDYYRIRWTPLGGRDKGTRMEAGVELPPIGRVPNRTA